MRNATNDGKAMPAWTKALASAFSLVLGLSACTGDDGNDGDDGAGTADSAGTADDTAGAGDFAFATDAPDAYTRVDRAGMPAIGTAVIASKDDYNQDGPDEDAAGTWVAEITASVTAFHDALDDDLTGLGLTPCAVDTCIEQAAPLVVPDTLKIDPAMPAGFPNGRTLPDPVIDVTLAVVMLDLSVHTATTLAEVPLNPPANDVAFSAEFPYVGEPH